MTEWYPMTIAELQTERNSVDDPRTLDELCVRRRQSYSKSYLTTLHRTKLDKQPHFHLHFCHISPLLVPPFLVKIVEWKILLHSAPLRRVRCFNHPRLDLTRHGLGTLKSFVRNPAIHVNA